MKSIIKICIIFIFFLLSINSLYAKKEYLADSNLTIEESLKPDIIRKLMMSNFNYYVKRMRSDIDGDWYRLHFYKMNTAWALAAWDHATLQMGIIRAYKQLKDPSMLTSLYVWTDKTKWNLTKSDPYIGNNHLAGEVYLLLNDIDKSKAKINNITDELNRTMDSPWTGLASWSWCDALFMSPPAYALLSKTTNDNTYLNFMHEKFLQCYQDLYDKKEHFFYRDNNFKYDPSNQNTISKNGEKIFWSRGNGWVIGGLARILEYFPKSDKRRLFYEQLLNEMASAFMKTQQSNGLWATSLLDAENFPDKEITGSGLICFAIAWGINNGILDKDIYQPVVVRAWNALCNCVMPNGAIGCVQPIGHDPQHVDSLYTNDFGIGIFLLAGSEMIQLCSNVNQ